MNKVSNPVDSSEINRLDFLKKAGSVALFAALGIPFLASCSSDSNPTSVDNTGNTNTGGTGTSGIAVSGNTVTLDLSKSDTSNLAVAGGWLLVTAAQVLVVNIGGNVIRAFTSVCTHSGCDRNWAYSNNQFTCTCHNSVFSNAGVKVSGPASADLREFQVTRNGDIVTIQK